jgi:hypothetical protein
MLKIDRSAKKFTRLNHNSLSQVELQERYDIQRMIRQSPAEFFAEIGERLLLVGEEICPADFCDDRIDLLALDSLGSAVVIEIKRGSNRFQLLQALAYAGMIAKWQPERFKNERSTLTNKSPEEIHDEIEEFLAEDAQAIGQAQRIILLAEGYDFEVLVTAEWLNEQYGVDIRCYRLVLSADGTNEYVNCVCIYPPPELTQHAEARGGARGGPPKPARWSNWDDALGQVSNQDLVKFYKDELQKGRDNYLRKRSLRYRVQGKIRWTVSARQSSAYVWQHGRFSEDVKFWEGKLTESQEVIPVKENTRLRFLLSTSDDFERFRAAVTGALLQIPFLEEETAKASGE